MEVLNISYGTFVGVAGKKWVKCGLYLGVILFLPAGRMPVGQMGRFGRIQCWADFTAREAGPRGFPYAYLL